MTTSSAQRSSSDTFQREFDPSEGAHGTNVSWFDASPKSIDPSTRQLLETYSGIPTDRVEQHIVDVRNRAFKVYSYPCLGQFRFLDLSIGKSAQYGEVLQRVKGGEKLLDLGCCLGQDLRRLVADGAPSTNVIGSDIEPGFHDLGFELFADRDTFKAALVVADMTQDPSSPGSPLYPFIGDVDMIYAASFFHLFDYATQVLLCKHSVAILRKSPGSIVFGRQVGNVAAGAKVRQIGGGRNVWRHNEESFRKLWEEVGAQTSTRWTVDIELTDAPGWTDKKSRGEWDSGEGVKRLRYCARML